MTLYFLLKTLHVLAAALWVGGMFFAILILRPSLQALEPAQRLALHARVFQRFFLVVWHAMPIVLLSGYAMIFWVFGGMAGTRWPIHVMTLLGLLMGAVFAFLYFVPYRRFCDAQDAPTKAQAVDSIRKLISFNLVLGVGTIIIAHIK